ncbi:MAG TPA: hypothetical protein ENK52_00740 [Saprospiraceae bacterium]|nr:hypothetical protein [Saprospiraceae bacterium]
MNIRDAKHWWLIALKGFVILMFGMLCMTFPIASTETMLMILALFVGLGGIFMMSFAFANPFPFFRNWFFLEALLDMIIAALIFFYPIHSAVALAWIFGFWLFVNSLFRLRVARIQYQYGADWKMPLLNGLLTLVLSIAIILYPISGVITFAYLLGMTTAFFGLFLIISSMNLWRYEKNKREVFIE